MLPPLPDELLGEVTLKVGDQVTTDDIIPSGSRMKYRSNIPEYSKFAFEGLDPTFHDRASHIRDLGKSNVVTAGFSYGQGSSREHAALCLAYLGVRAILAKSFERIHRSNLINFGILPCLFRTEADYYSIQQRDKLEFPNIRRSLDTNELLSVLNRTKGNFFKVGVDLTKREREILLAGGAIPYIRRRFGGINKSK
jgi:aconitate hydratase